MDINTSKNKRKNLFTKAAQDVINSESQLAIFSVNSKHESGVVLSPGEVNEKAVSSNQDFKSPVVLNDKDVAHDKSDAKLAQTEYMIGE